MPADASPAPSPQPERPASTPLSEISDNEDWRRSARISVHSLGGGAKPGSRPVSEVRDGADGNKRHSATLPVHTFTLNLADYTSTPRVVSAPPSALPSPSLGLGAPVRASGSVPRSPSAKSLQSPPRKPDKPAELSARPVGSAPSARQDEAETKDGAHPLLVAKRVALRPSPLGSSLPIPSSSTPLASPTPSFPPLRESVDSPRSSIETTSAPPTRAKPGWLRRASMAPGMRTMTKSTSLAASDTDSPPLPASASLPPALPPRGGITTTTAGTLLERARGSMPPPEVPFKPASLGAAPRSMLAAGQGRPALGPPPLPVRDNLTNFKGRLAAWTSASGGSGSGSGSASAPSSFSRSQSSQSLASAFTPSHQRVPSSAQRVLGNAGSAVSKGWAGLRSRGVGGSISGMSSLVQARREREPTEAASSWASSSKRSGDGGFAERAHARFATEGPVFGDGVVKRRAKDGRRGCVFGRHLADAGRTWGVHDAAVTYESESVYSQRRRMCLPAIVLRTVDYLEIWGPKEEGIFRISGRSSHIARLRQEFDAGADLDMTLCDPGDLDPHAVSGIFKMYLRELPSPLLTVALEPEFNAYLGAPVADRSVERLVELVKRLPSAHWFLLADIVKLIDLIPRHSSVNRMSHQALMLSLGPTLRLSGDMLDLFLRHRRDLFSEPPEPTLVESTTDLIDFGDIDIAPPSIAETETGDALGSGESALPLPAKPRKLPPRLPKKPSLSRLLSASGSVGNTLAASVSSASVQRRGSGDAMQSPVDPVAPRVDLPDTPAVDLPSFGGVEPAGETEDLASEPPASAPPVPAKSTDKVDDAHYAAGTVEERARAFTAGAMPTATTTTPIADRFKGTSTAATPLRTPRSSMGTPKSGTSGSAGSAPASPTHATGAAADLWTAAPVNPITVIRRGPPIFFSSAIPAASHARSLSANVADSPATATATGVKRKEDKEQPADADGSQSPAKRLSAGPGIIGALQAAVMGDDTALAAGDTAGEDEDGALKQSCDCL